MSLPAEIFEGESGRDKQVGEKRNEDDAHDCDTRSGHELLHSLGLRSGVIITVPFEQIHDAPHAETGSEGDDEGLENTDCAIKKCHKIPPL